MAEWVDVAGVSDIEPGTYRVVDVDDVMIAVFNIDGDFFAIEDVCTHDYSTLTGGPVKGCEIVCPRHGARFNIKTGEALCAPAYEAVATFPVQIEGETIRVMDDRWD